MSSAEETNPTEALFPVFVISILSIIVVPWTLGKLFQGKTQELQATGGKASGKPWRERLFTRSNLILAFLWVVLVAMMVFVSKTSTDDKPFDPFEVLEIPTNADDRAIKSAFRRLSLKYHPDKNPDPEAAVYFADYVSKAYKTLTDESAKENWIKYGHPDGPRSTKLGVALPSFLFDQNYRIMLLIGIVLLGILVPICFSMAYLGKSKKYTSSNIIVDTISIWAHPSSPVAIKQGHSLHRILETLICAAEFADFKVDAVNGEALDAMFKDLKRVMPGGGGSEPKFFKKRPSFIKAHFILLCHMYRIAVPKVVRQDEATVLKEAPRLMAGLMKVASMPRIAPLQYGWFAPAEAVVECMQCISQAVPTEEKRVRGGKGTPNGPLLQLPHLTHDALKRLAKGKDGLRAKTLNELQRLSDEDALSVLSHAGLTPSQAEEISSVLKAQPRVIMQADVFVDGENEIVALDPVTVKLSLVLARKNHRGLNAVPELRGKAMVAHCPRYPQPRQEKWYVLVGDQKSNYLYAWLQVDLAEAEECGVKRALTKDAKDARGEEGEAQVVTLSFLAPPPGSYDLTISCMSDAWLGCDTIMTKRMRVESKTRIKPEDSADSANTAAGHGGNKRSKSKAKSNGPGGTGGQDAEGSDDDDMPELVAVSSDEEGGEGSGSDDYSDSEEVLSDFSYDSEDTGTDIEEGDERSESANWVVPPKEDPSSSVAKK